ncbi:MAG TPA: hypothetical protein VGS62_11655 [Streptosporangiaceae bacterium]|nr:hypothetical protein [Streptosporangiaceae bacterium]
MPVSVLAAGSTLTNQVEPGVLGFLVVAGIGVALFFLLRSMNKQLRKISADTRQFAPRKGPEPADEDSFHNGSGPDA